MEAVPIGGTEMRSDEIRIPILGGDTIYDLYEAFIQELHRLEYIYVPNHTSGLAILDSWIASVEQQKNFNFTIKEKKS